MIDCSEKKGLSNTEYIRWQFYCGKLSSIYKNVLLHTSLLEGLIIERSEKKISHIPSECQACRHKRDFRTFREALGILDEEIGAAKKLLHKIYTQRSDLAHDITKQSQDEIDSQIKDIWGNILEIYKTSDFVNNLFQEHYGFKPQSVVDAIPPTELQQDS